MNHSTYQTPPVFGKKKALSMRSISNRPRRTVGIFFCDVPGGSWLKKTWESHETTIDKYPLVMTNIAIENDHL